MAQPQPDIPQSVMAIALDTNSMPHGSLDVKEIEKLADVINEQELDADIWIPEPVLWEWAEHLYAATTTATTTYRQAYREARAAGLELPELAEQSEDLHAVLGHLDEVLSGFDRVRILRLADHPEVAVAGLRDQILQLGAGRRKPDGERKVKTGAADSASWRLIEAQARDEIANVVLVTADRDAESHFSGRRMPVRADSLWALRGALFRLQTGTQTAVVAVKAAIEAQLPKLSAEALRGVSSEGGKDAFEFDDERYIETNVTVSSIGGVFAVDEVDVSRNDGYATAAAYVEVDLEMEYVWWDERTEEVEQTTDEALGLPASVYVSARYNEATQDWQVAIDYVVIGSA